MRRRARGLLGVGAALVLRGGQCRHMESSLTPKGICERYTDDTYAKMRDDAERTAAYTSAIADAAPGRVCLDVGTGALALLALIAARAGARHVYAIEANAEAAQAARATIAAEGFAD